MYRYCLFASILTIFLASSTTLSAQQTMTLQECISYAKQNNPRIKRAEVGIRQADLFLRQAELSRWPNLNASTNYGLGFGRAANADGVTVNAQTTQSQSMSINAGVVLWNGGRTNRTIEREELSLKWAELNMEGSADQVVLDVSANYLNVLLALEEQKRASEQVQISIADLERSQVLADAGTIPEGNLRELEAQIATDSLVLIQADNGVSLAYLGLRLAMQADENTEININIPTEDQIDAMLMEEDWDANEIFRWAAKNLPQYAALDIGLRAAEQDIHVNRAALYPTLSAGAGLSTNWFTLANDSLDIFPSYGTQIDNNFGQSIGLSLNIPIWNNNTARANIDFAEMELETQEYLAKESFNELRQLIEQAIADARASASQYRSTLRLVEARENALDFAEKRYTSGQGISFEFNSARNALAQAESQLLSAKYNYIFAKLTLEFYQGRPLEF
jgi:outer membrane protein